MDNRLVPYTDNGGTRLFWDGSGAGPAVLLIHGLGYTHDMWYRTVPALSAHYRVIRFDNRGVGRSDVPPGAYRVSDMAQDAAAVLDAAGVAAAHVVGVSLGGAIAQELTLRHPSRVRGLVLVATLCGGPRMVQAEPEVGVTLLARAKMPAEQGIRVMNPYVYDPGTADERIDEDLAIRLRTYPSAQGYLGQLQAVLSWSSYDRLPEITAPTLVIHGESDRLIPPGNGRIIAERIPGARLTLIPQASHILFTDQPETAHGALLGFLDELCQSGR
ncbi:MAG: alpha/beta fold hydrolase [Pseudonocardiaceae bacterium]